MSTIANSRVVLWRFFDGTWLLALVCAVWTVSVYDLNASKVSSPPVVVAPPEPPPELTPPEPPPVEAPPVELPPPLPKVITPELPTDPIPRVELGFFPNAPGRLGMVTTSGNPDDPKDDGLRMTFNELGVSNNTRIFVDGSTPIYGEAGCEAVTAHHRDSTTEQFESACKVQDVVFTHTVKLAPGNVSRRLDTARIVLVAKNSGDQPRRVGARFMIDTLIGGNDGVPFIVAGKQQLIQSAMAFRDREVPDFIRALQNSNLSDPGVIVDIGTRCPEADRPDEVVLSRWPGAFAEWEYDRRPLEGDSAVGLYFLPKALMPGESRTMGFTYGLGAISSTNSQNARLSLTAGGPFNAGASFWLVALVQSPKSGSTVQISLPEGMSLGKSETPSKPVTVGDGLSQISWLVDVAASTIGSQEVSVKLLPDDVVERQPLVIEPPSAKLTLNAPETAAAGKAFWVSAVVRNPKAGQTVELVLPAGFGCAKDHPAVQSLTPGKDFQQLNWLVNCSWNVVGNHILRAQMATGEVTAERAMVIEPAKSAITLTVPKESTAGKEFWVWATIQNAKPGQIVELTIPSGFLLSNGHIAKKHVASSKSYDRVLWLLKGSPDTVGANLLKVRLSPEDIVEEAGVTIVKGTIVE